VLELGFRASGFGLLSVLGPFRICLRRLLSGVDYGQGNFELGVVKFNKDFYALEFGVANRVQRQIGLLEIKGFGVKFCPTIGPDVEEAGLGIAQQNLHTEMFVARMSCKFPPPGSG
jgi:hypothetical protein